MAFIDLFFDAKVATLNFHYALKEFTVFKSRIHKGVEREVKFLAVPTRPHSLVFKTINFILILCLVASPLLLYSAWRSIAPLRDSITTSVNAAVSGLFSAKDLIEEQNYSGAESAFEEAGDNFLQAQSDLASINQGLLRLAGVIPNEQFRFASESKRILRAGQLSARIGAELALAASPSSNMNIVQFLDRFAAHGAPAADEAAALSRELKRIDANNLPEQYRADFIMLRGQAELLAPSLAEAVDLADEAALFLGKQMDKRYLLVFQNNSEKRASGGFIGSFALVDMSKGEIKNVAVPKGGSYDTEAGLSHLVAAPAPLWLVNPLWHFWDANWRPDWPKTARKLAWFYENSNGPTVDGVISLTPTVMERLLTVTGPIDMTKDYGVIINSENFWEVTQTFSEQKPDVTKEPKKIIGDLTTKLIEELPKNMSPEKAFSLIAVFEQSLREKHILLYFDDPSLEATVERFGWDGKIKQTDGDYLMVVSTNIGGQKSDRLINETLKHDAEILPDGSIIVTLRVERAHTAPKNQTFVGFRNVNWLRVYVPEGSELISSSGFRTPEQAYFEEPDPKWELDSDLENERQAIISPQSGTKIYREDGKTVFANWSMVDPGETAILEFRYRLPFKLSNEELNDSWIENLKSYITTDSSKRYSLLVQKQPGATTTSLITTLRLSESWQPVWQYPESLIINPRGWNLTAPLQTDIFTTVLFH